ncbi:MAG: TetR/AcrR family transcriptional regulator [Methylococcales bacterium]
MARRSDHSREEIRQMALDVAEKLVAENGTSFLTARRISSGIGYTVGSLYLVFENLDDLALQVNARTLDRLSLHLDRTVLQFEEPPRRCIVELGRSYIRFASDHSRLWNMIFEIRTPDELELPEWYRERILSLFRCFEHPFEKIRPDLPETRIKEAARALWSGIHGICILARTGKLDVVGLENVERASDLLCENFIDGWTDSAV